MIILYFSGTGNTKYLSEHFAEIMKSTSYSIEDNVDFKDLISRNGTIAFCYPIYGSCVPEIMRDFVLKHKKYLKEKNLIIFSTQMLFSGDGARVFTELIEGIDVNIIYAEHFNMPNNICNFFLLPVKSREKARRVLEKADRKLVKTSNHIKSGKVNKRGYNIFSEYVGLISQRLYFRIIEKKAKKDVRISPDCNSCGICVQVCPTKNLEIHDNKISQKGKCTLCYRCVNICPQKAITVLLHTRVRKQYNLDA